MKRIIVAALTGAVVIAGVAISGASAQDTIVPADYTHVITNPLFPISSFTSMTYEGEEEDPDTGETITTRVTFTVLPDVKTVGGVRVQVVRDDAYEDGELVESTLDYFAQHKDGAVYYFGEDVDNYEDGELKDHAGSWQAGVGSNLPGVFMPATPAVGGVFEQERAPGIAEDRSTILSIGESVTVPAGSFAGCIKTEDVNPLDTSAGPENKFYCPSVGLVRETAEGELLELASFVRAPVATPTQVVPVATLPALQPTRPTGVVAPNTGLGDADSGFDDAAGWMAAALALAAIGMSGAALAVARKR